MEVVKVGSSRQSRAVDEGKKEREFRFFWPPIVHFLHRLRAHLTRDRAYTTVATLCAYGTDSCSTFSPSFSQTQFRFIRALLHSRRKLN